MNSSFSTLTTPEEEIAFATGAGLGIGLIIVLFAFLFVLLIFSVVAYVFQGIGIMKMHEKLGLKNGWLAFVPYGNFFAIGKVAEQYVKANGKKSAKFSIIILVCGIINVIMSIFSNVLSSLTKIIPEVVPEGPALLILIGLLFLSLFVIAFAIFYCIIFYTALWRIFAIFSNGKATLFLVLSIFLPLQPFLIFAIRNNEPLNVEVTMEVPIAEEITEQVGYIDNN